VRPDHKLTFLIKRIAAVLGVALLLQVGGARAEEAPEEVVNRLNGALLETMQAAAEGLDYDGRYERLAPVLEGSFAFGSMVRIAVGPEWRSIAPDQRRELERLFAEMSIATFAARFDGYGGERFELVASEPGPRDAVLVKSQIVRRTDSPVGLDYLLREQDGEWRIIDVFLDSRFSELARQRSEFAAVLRNGGVDALVSTLENKIAEFAS
jgi:phospholipid transport system substrate-binding protein